LANKAGSLLAGTGFGGGRGGGGSTKLTAQLLAHWDVKFFQNKTIHRKFTYGRSGEERNIYSYYNKKAYINILKYFHSLI
jgi:hypothetical protein